MNDGGIALVGGREGGSCGLDAARRLEALGATTTLDVTSGAVWPENLADPAGTSLSSC